MHGKHRHGRRFGRRAVDCRPHPLIVEQSFVKGRRLGRAVSGGVGFHAADEVANDVRPVHQIRPQHIRCDQRIGQIDRRAGRQWSDQEFDQAYRARIALQQIPVPVDRDGGKRLLLGQHVVERLSNFAKFGRGKVGLAPDRGKAGSRQQRIVLAQRHVEGGRQPHHHIAAGRCAAQFHEAEMALRDFRAPGKIELRQAPVPAPPAQAVRKTLTPRHEYLPGSC